MGLDQAGLAVLAGLAAAGAAWLVASCLTQRLSLLTRLGLGAVMEEGVKTGMAALFLAPLALTHLVFGAVEATFQLLSSQPPSQPRPELDARLGPGPQGRKAGWQHGRGKGLGGFNRPSPARRAGPVQGLGEEQGRRASAAALALISHGSLGLLTEATAQAKESLIWGFAVAAAVHLAWNLGVGWVSERRKLRKAFDLTPVGGKGIIGPGEKRGLRERAVLGVLAGRSRLERARFGVPKSYPKKRRP